MMRIFLFLILAFSVTLSQNLDSLGDKISNDSNKNESVLIDDLLIKSSSSANDTTSNPNFNSSQKGVSVSYTRFVFALFIVSLMLFAFYMFLKKRYGTKKITHNTKNMDVLEEINIGMNRLYIVRAGSRVFVVGGGSSGLNHIHTFDSSETIDILSSYDEGMGSSTSGKFSDIVNGFLEKYKEK